MNTCKVTIAIESKEENVTEEFYIDADSFEEAVEKVRNDLDI